MQRRETAGLNAREEAKNHWQLSPEVLFAIISGAQTGVDRGALDAALEDGIPCGGWAPRGRLAEDGVIPSCYPVQELAQVGYRQRTKANVLDSDATVLIYFACLHGGTELALRFCMSKKKPYLLLDASELTTHRVSERIRMFVAENAIRRLNIAGPREGGAPGAWAYAHDSIKLFLRSETVAKK